MSWERWAARFARSVERSVDDALTRTGAAGARQVIPYRGFGSPTEVFVSGRVLSNPPAGPIDATDRWWRNLANAFRHLETDEVAGARLRLSIAQAERHAVTDEEGFYRAWLAPSRPLPPTGMWHMVDVEVIEPLQPGTQRLATSGLVLVPPPTARFGVISDLDDTVIRTDATRLIAMLRRTLLENARTRLPFAGVAEFYGGLHLGDEGAEANPVFYVSSSPWNLYPVLTEFLEFQTIPLGPLMLRDWGITERGVLPRGHGEHKLGAIRQILDCYPALPFILIGDSGQEDPEIYRDVVHQYRGRIHAVYIRNVSTDPARVRAIGELAEEVRAVGSELLLSDDTLAAARHAAERGWVGERTIRRVADAVSSS
ncbi:MAG TPA: phosphatase domain-containing protein [Longimicrobiales bacterium]|nr:phosphatase domain-containing protein [Longimicrobiales bacterium]